jgi:hypothetical protein
MGRHTAEIPLPSLAQIAGDRDRRALPPRPVSTDPDLLRAPLSPTPRTAVLDVATAQRIQRDLRTIALRPVAPPNAAPAELLPSELGPAPTDSLAAVDEPAVLEPEAGFPTGFRVRRTLSLAVCAVAVLSAVSGAAVLLPS